METPPTCPYADFDHNGTDHRATAEAAWRDMRALPGVPRAEAHGGFYVLTRYSDVVAAALDWESYTSAQGIAIPDLHFEERLVPIEYDPPRLRAYRRLVMRFLTPEAVRKHEPVIREVARSLTHAMSEHQRVDFVEAFARPFPTAVALHVLGFPREDAPLLDRLINTSIGGRGNDEAKAASAQLEEYIERFVTARRESKTSSDEIIGAIVGESGDDQLSPSEQLSFVKLLLFGGFTTTTFAISSFMHWIARHPGDRDRLAAQPELMKSAVDEIVRYSSPGTYLGRVATRDLDVAGTPIPAGSRVLLSYGSANRDSGQFDRPDDLVLDRSPNPHLGFGMGPHRCIGVHLAKLELTVAIETLLDVLPSFVLAPDADIHWMSGETQGMLSLPLVLG